MRAGVGCLLWLMLMGCGVTVGYNDNPSPVVRMEQLTAGDRIRVHSRSHGRVSGDLARVSPDSLVIVRQEEGRGELALPADAVTRVDITAGRRSRKGRGALIGLLAGGAGGMAGMVTLCGDSCVGGWILLALPVGGAVVGAGVGALIGSQIKTERWQRVSWP